MRRQVDRLAIKAVALFVEDAELSFMEVIWVLVALPKCYDGIVEMFKVVSSEVLVGFKRYVVGTSGLSVGHFLERV